MSPFSWSLFIAGGYLAIPGVLLYTLSEGLRIAAALLFGYVSLVHSSLEDSIVTAQGKVC